MSILGPTLWSSITWKSFALKTEMPQEMNIQNSRGSRRPRSWLVELLHCWGSASGHSITIAYISMHTLSGCILPALEDCTLHAHWGPHYPLSTLAQSGIWALHWAYKATSGWQGPFLHPFHLEKYLLRLGLFTEPQKILRAGLCGVRVSSRGDTNAREALWLILAILNTVSVVQWWRLGL